MKIRRIFICFIAVVCACALWKAHAQNADPIKSNPAYITGEGYGETIPVVIIGNVLLKDENSTLNV